jgi:tetratricopeptide (TPR) repeat protein
LLNRATDKNNVTVKADATVRIEALASIKKDYADAVVALDRALAILKTANDPDPKAQKGFAEVKYNTLEKRKEVFRLMSRTGADRTRGKEALVAFQEYIDATTDAKIKADAQAALTEVLMDSQEFELAITESEKILAQDPNNVNALAVAGLSLVNVGYINNDKSKLQQGSNYLQKFTEVAPDTNQYKADAKGLIESLKKEQNVTPQKSTRKKQ